MNNHSYIGVPVKKKRKQYLKIKQGKLLLLLPTDSEKMGDGVESRCSAGNPRLFQTTGPAASPGLYRVPHFLYLAVALKAGI
jgi:hypothetical protein